MNQSQAYLNAYVEVATVYTKEGMPYRIQVFLQDKTEDGYLCLLPHDVTKRLHVEVGVGPRYDFKDGNAIRVPMYDESTTTA